MTLFSTCASRAKMLFEKTHLFFLGVHLAEFSTRFAKNLLALSFGTGAEAVLLFAVNILILRFLTPEEFGKWNIIISISELAIIIPLFGFGISPMRYLGSNRDKQKEIVGTSWLTISALSLCIFPLFFVFAPRAAEIFKIPPSLLSFGLWYSVISVFVHLFQGIFQGLEQFKFLAWLKISSALIIALITFLFLFGLRDFSFETIFWPKLSGLAVLAIVGLFKFRTWLLRFSKEMFWQLVSFGGYYTVSVLIGFFGQGVAENFIINYFLGPAQVGLYGSYFIIFSVVIGRIIAVFSQVFLPMASRHGNVSGLYRPIMTFMRKTSLPIILCVFFATWILFQFYNREFIFDWKIALVLSAYTMVYGFTNILSNLIITFGARGMRIGMILSAANSLVLIGLNILLIPRFQLFGAVLATLFSSMAMFFGAIYVINRRLLASSR